MTDERVHESKVFKGMLEGMEGRGEKVREVIMDGGYDRGEVWRETESWQQWARKSLKNLQVLRCPAAEPSMS